MVFCGLQIDNSNYRKAGFPGIAVALTGGGNGGSGMIGSSSREFDRFFIRDAWNGQAATKRYAGRYINATPFRAVMNAGDLLTRVSYVSGGSNQVKGSITNQSNRSANVLAGSIHPQLDLTRIPSATGNGRYVYDSSDYTRFRKQQAVKRNYNDYSSGGDMGSNTLIALGRVRH